MEAAIKRAAIAMLLIIAACAQNRVDRSRWQQMSAQEKTIYVQSMIGHAKARAHKGGDGRSYPLSPQKYVRRIDAAYARGEARNPDTIFEEMGSSR